LPISVRQREQDDIGGTGDLRETGGRGRARAFGGAGHGVVAEHPVSGAGQAAGDAAAHVAQADEADAHVSPPFGVMTRAASSNGAGSHAPAPPPGRTVLTQAEPPSTDSTSPLT